MAPSASTAARWPSVIGPLNLIRRNVESLAASSNSRSPRFALAEVFPEHTSIWAPAKDT